MYQTVYVLNNLYTSGTLNLFPIVV